MMAAAPLGIDALSVYSLRDVLLSVVVLNTMARLDEISTNNDILASAGGVNGVLFTVCAALARVCARWRAILVTHEHRCEPLCRTAKRMVFRLDPTVRYTGQIVRLKTISSFTDYEYEPPVFSNDAVYTIRYKGNGEYGVYKYTISLTGLEIKLGVPRCLLILDHRCRWSHLVGCQSTDSFYVVEQSYVENILTVVKRIRYCAGDGGSKRLVFDQGFCTAPFNGCPSVSYGASLPFEYNGFYMTVSSDGRHLWCEFNTRRILLDAQTGQLLMRLVTPDSLSFCDRYYALTNSNLIAYRVYDAARGKNDVCFCVYPFWSLNAIRDCKTLPLVVSTTTTIPTAEWPPHTVWLRCRCGQRCGDSDGTQHWEFCSRPAYSRPFHWLDNSDCFVVCTDNATAQLVNTKRRVVRALWSNTKHQEAANYWRIPFGHKGHMLLAQKNKHSITFHLLRQDSV